MTTPSPESIERAKKALGLVGLGSNPCWCVAKYPSQQHMESCSLRHVPAVALAIDEAVREEREQAIARVSQAFQQREPSANKWLESFHVASSAIRALKGTGQ
jgi:hypothetical protein